MAINHGWGKFANFAERSEKFAAIVISPTVSLALATFAEFFCAILVVVGLATRLSLIPLIITMAVAFLIAHAGDPFTDKEPALLYLIAYSVLFLSGPGRFSLDTMLFGRGEPAD
ncbi:MAG: DoxX family protein [Armatimonadetes bacterium]|nr:DoxX family protein [Armatimonadota bacterium]